MWYFNRLCNEVQLAEYIGQAAKSYKVVKHDSKKEAGRINPTLLLCLALLSLMAFASLACTDGCNQFDKASVEYSQCVNPLIGNDSTSILQSVIPNCNVYNLADSSLPECP
jgi:hypothetical protein